MRATGVALGIATAGIAPADRKLYALRDRTATVDSLPLIVASILSKKLATGASGIVFDVKVGDAAFLPGLDQARQLARMLVEVSRDLGLAATALLSDMSQPLGDWAGHACEVREALDCLEGRGPRETVELTLALALELGRSLGFDWTRGEVCAGLLASGAARERFVRWAVAQGAVARWFDAPELPLAPVERVIAAPRAGVVARVATRQLGLLLAEAGARAAQRRAPTSTGASRCATRLASAARSSPARSSPALYLRRDDPALVARFAACFEIADAATAPSAPPLLSSSASAERRRAASGRALPGDGASKRSSTRPFLTDAAVGRVASRASTNHCRRIAPERSSSADGPAGGAGVAVEQAELAVGTRRLEARERGSRAGRRPWRRGSARRRSAPASPGTRPRRSGSRRPARRSAGRGQRPA